jgi:hypothetical protein
MVSYSIRQDIRTDRASCLEYPEHPEPRLPLPTQQARASTLLPICLEPPPCPQTDHSAVDLLSPPSNRDRQQFPGPDRTEIEMPGQPQPKSPHQRK